MWLQRTATRFVCGARQLWTQDWFVVVAARSNHVDDDLSLAWLSCGTDARQAAACCNGHDCVDGRQPQPPAARQHLARPAAANPELRRAVAAHRARLLSAKRLGGRVARVDESFRRFTALRSTTAAVAVVL